MDTYQVFLSPPIVLVIVLTVMLLTLFGLSFLSFKGKRAFDHGGKIKAYACGEDLADHNIRPDYDQFFRFAFAFTILDVAALVIATTPAANLKAVFFATLYIVTVLVSLFILLRKHT